MARHRLDPLLRPRSIAVVGASARSGSVGNETLNNLSRGGFTGPVYAVNPNYSQLGERPCYPSLAALPAVPQLVVFAVSDARLEPLFEAAVERGVEACVIFTALALADDPGPGLRQRVADRARSAGMLLHGANCMGFFNFLDGVWASGFDTRAHSGSGNVALLSQSGAGMSGILDCEARLDFVFAASTGQELGVSLEDYLDFVLDLPQTRVVGLFLETSRHPAQLRAALDKARRLRIPIVALKVGRTALAAELAVSHSGALAGNDASYQAVFDYYGVQRVDDMAQLATALIVFAACGELPKGALATLHDSGGERQLAIDLAEQLAVPLATLAPETTHALAQLLDPGMPAVNPLDAWGSGGAQTMQSAFTLQMRDPAVALGALVHDRAPEGKIYPAYIEYLRAARAATGKPVFLVANYHGSGFDEQVLAATAEGLPVIDGLREFLIAAKALMNYRDFLGRAVEPIPALDEHKLASWRDTLGALGQPGEALSGAFLRDFGIPVLEGLSLSSLRELQAVADTLSFPVVLKTAAPGLSHKTDCGGVYLNIAGREELLLAYQDLSSRLGPKVLLSPMLEDAGVEMILGAVTDPQFGPIVILGFGGIHVEALADVAVLLPPFGVQTVHDALMNLRASAVLLAHRGRPPLRIEAFCEAASRLSVLALAMVDTVAEIDINPVRLTPTACVGLDALLVTAAGRGCPEN